MPTILRHDDVTFEDAVVPMAGHAYFNCTFRKCTMLYRGFMHCDGCHFEACIWHFDLLITDANEWLDLNQFMEDLGLKCLPAAPTVPGRKASE